MGLRLEHGQFYLVSKRVSRVMGRLSCAGTELELEQGFYHETNCSVLLHLGHRPCFPRSTPDKILSSLIMVMLSKIRRTISYRHIVTYIRRQTSKSSIYFFSFLFLFQVILYIYIPS